MKLVVPCESGGEVWLVGANRKEQATTNRLVRNQGQNNDVDVVQLSGTSNALSVIYDM